MKKNETEKNKMNIGLLISNLHSGGAERSMSNISKMLADKYNVYFFIFNSESVSYEISGTLIDLNCREKRNKLFKAVVFIKRVAKVSYYKRRLKLNLVISFLNSANIVNMFSPGRAKVFISCRGYSNYIKNKELYAKFSRKYYKLIFQTERLRSEFIQDFNIKEDKTTVLPNSFEINSITESAKEPLDKELVDFIRGRKVIISVGSFKRDKGLWNLIKVFALVKKQYEDVCLIIAGHMGEMENQIKNMADKSAVKTDIYFTGYTENPFKYMANADIYACTSLYEGFPNTIVESMICGNVVVSTDCKTGPREILSMGKGKETIDKAEFAEYGVLCPVFRDQIDFDEENIDEQHMVVCDAILSLLRDRDKVSEYKRKSAQRAATFSTESVSEKLIGLIESSGSDE